MYVKKRVTTNQNIKLNFNPFLAQNNREVGKFAISFDAHMLERFQNQRDTP